MPATIKIRFTVKKPDWMSNVRRRWEAGLLYLGDVWTSAEYPDVLPSGLLHDSIRERMRFRIIEGSLEIELQTVFYYKYLLYGTGLYGPLNHLIYPVVAKALHWVDPSSGEDVFAAYIKGMHPWEGEIDALKAMIAWAFQRGCISEFAKYYMRG